MNYNSLLTQPNLFDFVTTFDPVVNILKIVIIIKIIEYFVVAICFATIMKKYYNEPIWIGFVPVYNYYILAKHTFGEKYAWIGGVAGLVWFFAVGSSLMYLLTTLFTGWFLYSVYSRIDSRQSSFLWIMAAAIPVIFLPILLFISDLKYQGPKAPFFIKDQQ